MFEIQIVLKEERSGALRKDASEIDECHIHDLVHSGIRW